MTGGTIARYLAEGAQVLVVTFTLGGERRGDRRRMGTAGRRRRADQLGGYRIFELTTALAALEPAGSRPATPVPGRRRALRDSGMAGSLSAEDTRGRSRRRRSNDGGPAGRHHRRVRPAGGTITYDKAGTHGLSDHVGCDVTAAAALPIARARLSTEMKVYESVTEHSALETESGGRMVRVPLGWRMPGDEGCPLPGRGHHRRVDAVRCMSARLRRTIATQVTVAASGTPEVRVCRTNIPHPDRRGRTLRTRSEVPGPMRPAVRRISSRDWTEPMAAKKKRRNTPKKRPADGYTRCRGGAAGAAPTVAQPDTFFGRLNRAIRCVATAVAEVWSMPASSSTA